MYGGQFRVCQQLNSDPTQLIGGGRLHSQLLG